MVDYKVITSAVLFTTIMGFMLDLGGFVTFTILTPASFLVGEALLLAVIELANTPLAKGIALGIFALWLFGYLISVQVPYFSEIIYAVLFVPNFLTIGLILLEAGKG